MRKAATAILLGYLTTVLRRDLNNIVRFIVPADDWLLELRSLRYQSLLPSDKVILVSDRLLDETHNIGCLLLTLFRYQPPWTLWNVPSKNNYWEDTDEAKTKHELP